MSRSTIPEILDRILDKGVVQSNEELQICCPECSQDDNTGLYVIASVETYLKFAEAVGLTGSGGAVPALGFGAITPNNDVTCCVHITASVETTLKFNEACGAPTNINCPTNFNECVNSIKETLTAEGVDRILDKGIVEFGSLSGLSQVCRLKEFIDLSLELDPLNSSSNAEILDRILDKGIIISCYGTDIIMASVETWLKWAEAVGLTESASVPALSFTGDTTTQSGDTITQSGDTTTQN